MNQQLSELSEKIIKNQKDSSEITLTGSSSGQVEYHGIKLTQVLNYVLSNKLCYVKGHDKLDFVDCQSGFCYEWDLSSDQLSRQSDQLINFLNSL